MAKAVVTSSPAPTGTRLPDTSTTVKETGATLLATYAFFVFVGFCHHALALFSLLQV